MLRILRAFAWMRWRVFVNSLQKTGARDAVQRVSMAIEHLAPLVVAVVMIPSAIVLTGLAGAAGYQLVSQTGRINPFAAIRVLLLIATVFCVAAPIAMPGADRTNPVRLLLLPISARTLYVAQAGGALADPWIILTIPPMLSLPLGLLIGGAGGAALVALAAGIALVLTLIGLSALMTTVVHLVLRDRRRGELVALVFILVLPIISFLPAVFGSPARLDRRPENNQTLRQEGTRPEESRVVLRFAFASGRAFAATPSELYTTTVATAARSGATEATATLVVLVASGVAVHGIGLVLFRRVLSSPGTTGPRRVASMRGVWGRLLPGVSPGTSAVALTLLRLALRTPRGRSILLAPVLMLGVFGFIFLRSDSFFSGPFRTANGLTLATLVSGLSLLSILPISMNQFAVDRAGLTMTLLSPLTTRQLLIGKAIGGALIAMPPALLCALLAALVFPGGAPALWLTLILSLVATYVLAAPAAAVLSAVFPRKVDMNSIGRGSNAHGLAGFLGLLAFVGAAVPCAALTLVATSLLDRPWLAPGLLLIWCVAAGGLARLLFVLAEKIFDHRRENLAMLI